MSICAMLAAAPSSAGAAATPETFVTMHSESGDWVGQGANRFYHPGNGEIWLAGDGKSVRVGVRGGNTNDYFWLTFEAPEGEVLAPGEYEHAQRFADAGRPGISVSGDGRGCNTAMGRFRVKSIEFDSEGAVTAFWVVYEQRCGRDESGLFGEVRYNVPGDGGMATIGARNVRWPTADGVHEAMKEVPVTVTNPGTSPIALGQSVISGPQALDFAVSDDGCSGVVLGPTETCQVLVRFDPSGPGERAAELDIPEQGGYTHTTDLEGFVFPGTTRLLLHSDPGEWVGEGKDHAFTPANAKFKLYEASTAIHGHLTGANGYQRWYFDFRPPTGEPLVSGATYDGATRSGGATPLLSVTGNGHGCNEVLGSFTILDLEVDPYDEVQRLSLVFEQHCDGDEDSPALHGVFDFRAGAPTDLPPHEVAVSIAGSGSVVSSPAGIDCGDDCAEVYPYGTSVTLAPQPAPGYWFAGWSGSCSGSTGCVVKTSKDRLVQAEFAPDPPPAVPKIATFTTLRARARPDYVTAHGRVRPVDANLNQVAVSLAVKRKDGFTKVASEAATLDTDGRYHVFFERPRGKLCRAVVRYSGDEVYDPSHESSTFEC